MILAALTVSQLQRERFAASAQVLINRQSIVANITGANDPTAYGEADRLAQTQAKLARVRLVAERTLRAANVRDRSASDLLGASSVTADPNSDIVRFEVEDHDPALAARLAHEYARQFVVYRRQLDTASYETARARVRAELESLRRTDPGGTSRLYGELASKDQQLQEFSALQTGNTSLLGADTRGHKVAPRPVLDGILGLGLGLVLGLAAAFVGEALDTRVRTPEDAAELVDLPLLARIPTFGRALRSKPLVMVWAPGSPEADTFRLLRANLEFTDVDHRAKFVLVTSALPEEGKSVTVSNLAVALAQAGKQVTLVDLDLRRPTLARVFDVDGGPGLTDVVAGRVELADALIPVDVAPDDEHDASTNGTPRGQLLLVPAGSVPPNPDHLLTSQRLHRLLADVAAGSDVVLLDAPPILGLSDTVTLAARADAIVVLANLAATRRSTLMELRRVLDALPARRYGLVVTGSGGADAGYYGYGRHHKRYASATANAKGAAERDTAGRVP